MPPPRQRKSPAALSLKPLAIDREQQQPRRAAKAKTHMEFKALGNLHARHVLVLAGEESLDDDVSETELLALGRCPGRQTKKGKQAPKRTSTKLSSDLTLAMMARFCRL